MRRARDGDEAALGELYGLYQRRMLRFCLSFAAIREADAADLVQEIFVRALGGIRRLRRPERFESWLFAIARRRCMSHLRRVVRQRRGAERWVEEQRLALEGEADRRRREREMRLAAEEIERLEDSGPRRAGKLFYLEGRDTGQIAAELGVPVSTVTTWLSRLRARVRKRLVLRVLELRSGAARLEGEP